MGTSPDASRIWTVAEAKSRLSEVLRLSEREGPQRIGTRQCYIVVPERVWREAAGETAQRQPMGRWLLDHIPRGEELPPPSRSDGAREIPFADENGA